MRKIVFIVVCLFVLIGCQSSTTEVPHKLEISIGAFVKENGWEVDNIDQFNADVARSAEIINLFSGFNGDWSHLKFPLSNVVSRNAVPMISWMPSTSEQDTSDILSEIIDGKWDGYFDTWIDGFQQWQNGYEEKPKIFLRFAHEANGYWYPWGDRPEDLKKAWRYVYKQFNDAKVNDDIHWVWSVGALDVDHIDDVAQYYPGDDVVDWLALDGYNWGSNFAFTRWESFDEIFSFQYRNLVAISSSKPIMISEIGSAEPDDLPDLNWGQTGDDSDANESKEEWVEDLMSSLQDYPQIKALVWFNIDKELNWGLNQAGNTGLTAFNKGLENTYPIELFSSKQLARPSQEPFLPLPPVIGECSREKQAQGFKELPASFLREVFLQPHFEYP